MARDGSGTYSLPVAPFVNGSTIDAGDVNSDFSDIASALTQSMSKDGQTTPTANQAMAGFKHTGVGAAASRTDYARADQVMGDPLSYAIDTGAADAYTIAPSPGITAYAVGQSFKFKVINANATTTPTLNVNSVGAGVIKWPDGTALAAGDLPANAFVEVIVSATTPVFHLQTVAIPSVGIAGAQTITGNKTFSGNFTATAGTNSFTGTIGSASVGTTQSQKDNSTKLATTAYVDRVGVQQVVSTITGAVNSGSTAIPWDDTIPQNTEGDEYMTLAITPKSSASKLVIDVVFNYSFGSADVGAVALFQDSTADALAVGYMRSDAPNGGAAPTVFRHVMTSGTTSATTFKVRAGTNGSAVVTFNGAATARKYGGKFASSIVITEIGV